MSDIKETIDEQLGGSLSKTEQFYEKNKRAVQIAGGVIVLAIVGFFGFRYMQQSKETEALSKVYMIDEYFKIDSFEYVLNGNPKDAEPMGGIDFVDEYGSTPTGQRVAYMVGRAYMAKGDYNNALEYLKKFNLDDEILRPSVIGLIGDCYSELNNMDEAADYYKKAASYSKNPYTAPKFLKKLAMVQENLGQNKEAAASYTRIKKEYAETEYARDIDKFISRANAKAGVSTFDN